MVITIAPVTFTEATTDDEKNVLIELIKQSKSPFLVMGNHKIKKDGQDVTINLCNHMLVRRRERAPEQMRIEILGSTQLNSGAFGVVFQSLGVLIPEKNYAFNTKTPGKERICKIITVSDTISKERVTVEANNTRKNSLLHCKSAIVDNNYGFIVMRKVCGRDLFSVVDDLLTGELFLSVKQRLQLCYAISKAVKEQVWDLGLRHNDLKPENIMVDLKTMMVTIIDFGSACPLDAEPEGEFFGSLQYLAPEILRDNIVTKADSFALGLCLGQVWNDISLFKKPYTSENALKYQLNRTWCSLFENIKIDETTKHRVTKYLNELTQLDTDLRIGVDTAMLKWKELLDCYEEKPSKRVAKSSLTSKKVTFDVRLFPTANESKQLHEHYKHRHNVLTPQR